MWQLSFQKTKSITYFIISFKFIKYFQKNIYK